MGNDVNLCTSIKQLQTSGCFYYQSIFTDLLTHASAHYEVISTNPQRQSFLLSLYYALASFMKLSRASPLSMPAFRKRKRFVTHDYKFMGTNASHVLMCIIISTRQIGSYPNLKCSSMSNTTA